MIAGNIQLKMSFIVYFLYRIRDIKSLILYKPSALAAGLVVGVELELIVAVLKLEHHNVLFRHPVADGFFVFIPGADDVTVHCPCVFLFPVDVGGRTEQAVHVALNVQPHLVAVLVNDAVGVDFLENVFGYAADLTIDDLRVLGKFCQCPCFFVAFCHCKLPLGCINVVC
ncbi:hypothetical protein [Pseudomonas phage vB_Pa-PAC2]